MPRNRHRVLILDTVEFATLQAKYLPLASVGVEPFCDVTDPKEKRAEKKPLTTLLDHLKSEPAGKKAKLLENLGGVDSITSNIKQYNQELYEYGQALYMTVPHHFRPESDLRIEGLAATFAAKWQALIPKDATSDLLRKIRDEQIFLLKKEIAAILKGIVTLSNEYQDRLDLVKKPEELQPIFDYLIDQVKTARFKSDCGKTALDLINIEIDGQRVENTRTEDLTLLKKFHHLLENKGLNQNVIDFLSRYLNQNWMGLGPNIFGGLLKMVVGPSIFPGAIPDHVYKLSVVNENTIEIKHVQEFRDSQDVGMPGEAHARSELVYRVSYDHTKNAPHNIIVQPISGYFDIYHEKLRHAFLKARIDGNGDPHSPGGIGVALKVRPPRDKQPLKPSSNDQRALNLYLSEYIDENGKLITAKVKKADDKTLYLLMWNDCAHAEAIFKDSLFSQHKFFCRDYNDVINDLTLIQRKYSLKSETIKTHTKSYLRWLGVFNTYLTAPAGKAHALRNIASALESGDGRDSLLTSMLAINDRNFIHALIDQKPIRSRLSSTVLTHFALQDRTIAAKLLKVSLWDRFKFRVRSFVNRIRGVATVNPIKQRFNSAQLKQIVIQHPDLWNTDFAPGSYARKSFDPKELDEILSPPQPRTSADVIAKSNLSNDLSLIPVARAYRPLSLAEEMEENANDPKMNLGLLIDTPEHFQKLKEFHKVEGNEKQLRRFYKAKFDQEARRKTTFLVQTAEDLWGESPDDNPNHALANPDIKRKQLWVARLPAEKREVVKAALIDAIGGYYVNVAESKWQRANSIGEYVSVADIFVLNPLEDAFQAKVFSSAAVKDALKKALLNNPKALSTLLPPCSFSFEASTNLAESFKRAYNNSDPNLKAHFQNIFTHPIFLKLVKSSKSFHNALKEVFNSPAIKELADNNLSLNTLIKNLFSIAPNSVADSDSYETVLHLFKEESLAALVKSIREFTYEADGKTYSPLYEQLVNLHTQARFYQTMRAEKDLFLFNHFWEKYQSQPEALINLLLLFSKENKFENWLETNTKKCRYLIELMIQNPIFRQQFEETQPTEVIAVLLQKAKVKHLSTLLLQSNIINKVYFDKLKAIGLDSTASKRFVKILNHIDPETLALHIVKNPEILKLLPNAVYEDANLVLKLFTALNYVYSIIAPDQIAILKSYSTTVEKIMNLVSESFMVHSDKVKSEIQEVLDVNDQQKIPQILITRINANPSNISLLKGYLTNHTLINSFLQHGMPADFAYIIELLLNQSSLVPNKQLATILNDFCNVVVMKMSIRPAFRENVIANTQLKKYLSNYAEPELLARAFTTHSFAANNLPMSLEGFEDALSRIAAQKTLFITYLPSLCKLTNFGHWFFHQAHSQPNSLFYIHKERQLISDELVTTLLESGQYQINDLIKLMDKQNRAEQPNPAEPSVRKILIDSESARIKFKSLAHGHTNDVINLCIEEVELFPKSTLLEDWLSLPFLNYLVESSSNESIELLIDTLSKCGRKDLTDRVVDSLIACAVSVPAMKDRLSSSEKLLSVCLSEGLIRNPQGVKPLLVEAFETPVAPNFVKLLPEHGSEYLNFISTIQDGNGLIKIYLELLAYINNISIEEMRTKTDILSMIKHLGEEHMGTMLDPNLNTDLQQQLLKTVFGLIGIPSVSFREFPQSLNFDSLRRKLFANEVEQVNHQHRLYEFLKQMDLYNKPKDLRSFIYSLSADEMVDLYQAVIALRNYEDSKGDENNRISVAFTDAIQSKPIIHSIFAQASDQKLRQLLTIAPNLINSFMELAKVTSDVEVRNTPESLRLPKDDALALSKDLQERVLKSRTSKDTNLLSTMIKFLPASDFKLQFEFLRSNENLFNAYIEEIKINHAVIAERDEHFIGNLEGIIKHGNIVMLTEVIKAFNTTPNEVTRFLVNLILGPSTPLRVRFMEYLSTNEKKDAQLARALELQKVFFNSIKSNLTTKDVYQLLQKEEESNKREFEAIFINHYSQNAPQELVSILHADLEQTHRSSKKAEDLSHAIDQDLETFVQYFFDSPKFRKLYFILNQYAPDSLLTKAIDIGFERKNLRPALFLTSDKQSLEPLTPADYAELYNIESNGIVKKLKNSTPLTDCIFNDPTLVRKLLQGLIAIKKEFLNGFINDARLKKALAVNSDDVVKTSLEHAQTITPFFKVVKDTGLQLIGLPGQEIEPEHELLYFSANYIEFLHRLREPGASKITLYVNYITDLTEYAKLDKEGVFRFIKTGNPIPPTYCILYYEVLAFFFYLSEHKSNNPFNQIKDNIRKFPAFAQGLTNSLSFGVNGKASFKFKPVQSGVAVPAFYIHSVLYAYTRSNENPAAMDINIAKAFLRSVRYIVNKFYFYGVENDSWNSVSDNYLRFVSAAIKKILAEDPGFFACAEHLKTLTAFAEIDFINNPVIVKVLLQSVHLKTDGKIYFKDRRKVSKKNDQGIVTTEYVDEEPSEKYLQLISGLLSQNPHISNGNVLMLSCWNTLKPANSNTLPISPLDILKMFAANPNNDVIMFRNNLIQVPNYWWEYLQTNIMTILSEDRLTKQLDLDDIFVLAKFENFMELLSLSPNLMLRFSNLMTQPSLNSILTDSAEVNNLHRRIMVGQILLKGVNYALRLVSAPPEEFGKFFNSENLNSTFYDPFRKAAKNRAAMSIPAPLPEEDLATPHLEEIPTGDVTGRYDYPGLVNESSSTTLPISTLTFFNPQPAKGAASTDANNVFFDQGATSFNSAEQVPG